MTQNNLGNVLKEQGIRTGGEEGSTLLSQAVEAYREALKEFERGQHSYYAARTKGNLREVEALIQQRQGAGH